MDTKTDERSCAWCEYFDGGGELRVALARTGPRLNGDCLSSRGAKFEPWSDEIHPGCFVPESRSDQDEG